MKTIKPNTRRNFLLAAGLGSAGAVAAVATGRKAPKVAAATDDTAGKSDGYRASPHVMKYYKTTEV
jgi:hypothetical protein